jgi:hypothetical protein
MPRAILALGTEPHAIRKCGLESVVVSSDHIQVPVGDQSRQILPHALPHDSRLPMIHAEAFIVQNRGDVYCEALDSSFQYFVSGERKIVGVPRVCGAYAPRYSD